MFLIRFKAYVRWAHSVSSFFTNQNTTFFVDKIMCSNLDAKNTQSTCAIGIDPSMTGVGHGNTPLYNSLCFLLYI